MLTCITCSKQKSEDDESARGTPHTKEAVKSLTAQIKDIALKVSGKQSKPSTPGSHRRVQRSYPDFDTISEGVPYPFMQPGSSNSSTPAWDFNNNHHHPSSQNDSKFIGVYGGDRTPHGGQSKPSDHVVVDNEDEPKEWTAQVEPGIQITFVSLPEGGNDLKRVRFSRDMYDKWEAQRWWGENYDRIMELYNVQRFNRQALDTPARSENGRDSSYSRLGSARESPMMTPSGTRDWSRNNYKPSGSQGYFPSDFNDNNKHFNAGSSAYGNSGMRGGEMSSMDASRTIFSGAENVFSRK